MRLAAVAVSVLLVVGLATWLLSAVAPGALTAVHLTAVGSAAALLLAVLAHADGRRRRTHDAKFSHELDGMSQRLIRLEARLSALDGSGSRASSTITDMAGDVSALSGVVRDLAEALAGQEREVAALRARSDRGGTFRDWSFDETGGDSPAIVPSFFPPAEHGRAAEPARIAPEPAIRRNPSPFGGGLDTARIDLHAQPIVSLPQRRPKIWEVYPLLRISEGQVLMPAEFTAALEETGQLAELDAKVLARAMSFARRLWTAGSDALVLCSLSSATLRQREPLARLRGILEADAQIGPRLLVEVPQAEWAGVRDGVASLRQHGLSFALGKVAHQRLDPPGLSDAGVRLAKVAAAELMLPENGSWAQALPLALAHHGIQVVADGVVADGIVPELIDLEVPLAQGFAFALPSPIETILEGLRPASGEAARPAAAEPVPAARPGPATERMPLRSFLKRNG